MLAKVVAIATGIEQWHKSIQDLLFHRGFKLNSEVLKTISITLTYHEGHRGKEVTTGALSRNQNTQA